MELINCAARLFKVEAAPAALVTNFPLIDRLVEVLLDIKRSYML